MAAETGDADRGGAETFTLSTDAVRPEERFDFYRASLQSLVCPMTMSQGNRPDFQAAFSLRPLGTVTALEFKGEAQPVVSRTRADIARGALDQVFVFRQLAPAGSGLRMPGHAEGIMNQGDFMIFHSDEPYDSHPQSGFHHRVWALDRALVPVAGRALDAVMRGLRLPAQSGMAAILGAYTGELGRQAHTLGPDMTAAVAANLGRLAAIAAGARAAEEAGAEGLAAGQLALVRERIERRLGDPLLSPARVAAVCGVSVRKLHALFEPTGESLSRYVMRRRLEEARAILAGGGAPPIADLAFSLGFNSLSAFYRSYRAGFGETPGDTRERARLAR